MRLYGLKVIVHSPMKPQFNKQEGEILTYRLDQQGRFVFLIRFKDKLDTFFHDEITIHPQEIEQYEGQINEQEY